MNSTQHLTLSEEQENAVMLALCGENVFITGSGGVGKSVVLRTIVKELRDQKQAYVGITASTGIAALAINGTTLHSWAGVGLGNGTTQELLRLVKKNRKALRRWRNTDTLVIDEVSMIEPLLFEKLNAIAKDIRFSTKPFGGMQLIVLGDFFQLMPVSAGKVQDPAQWEFCFESTAWEQSIQHVVELHTVFRQSDPDFISVLEEIRHGQLSEHAQELLKSRLGITLDTSDDIEPTELYSTNRQVDSINLKRLQQLDPELEHSFSANLAVTGLPSQAQREYAKKKMISACQAEVDIKLRIGTQVLLLINLNFDRGLVNGSRGVVVGFRDTHPSLYERAIKNKNAVHVEPDIPIVKFVNRQLEALPRYSWQWDNKEEGWNSRFVQVPLKLAYALTIHRAQGMSLDKVKADLGTSIFAQGQSYVALSRVRSLEGLSLASLSIPRIRAHPKVVRFYAQARAHEQALKDAVLAREASEQQGTTCTQDVEEKKRKRGDN